MLFVIFNPFLFLFFPLCIYDKIIILMYDVSFFFYTITQSQTIIFMIFKIDMKAVKNKKLIPQIGEI